MAIDGSKYYYWKGRFLATGSLKAFDLMTRHYEAGNFADYAPPVGKRRKVEDTTFLRITPSTLLLDEIARDLVEWHRNLPEPQIWKPLREIKPPMAWLARQSHVHLESGTCIKNRYGPRCLTRNDKGLQTVTTEGDIL